MNTTIFRGESLSGQSHTLKALPSTFTISKSSRLLDKKFILLCLIKQSNSCMPKASYTKTIKAMGSIFKPRKCVPNLYFPLSMQRPNKREKINKKLNTYVSYQILLWTCLFICLFVCILLGRELMLLCVLCKRKQDLFPNQFTLCID